MRNFWIIVIVIIVIAGGWYLWQANQGTDSAMQGMDSAGMQAATTTSDMGGAMASTTPQGASQSGTPSGTGVGVDVGVGAGVGMVKEVEVDGSNFAFSPKEIRVKEGARVKVTFKNTGGMHDFVLDAFNVRTNIIKGGESQTVEFVANKKGTFEYYCSVGTHRQMGMVGNLVVE